MEDAKRWLVGFLGKATADARLVVGRARLRRDPLFVCNHSEDTSKYISSVAMAAVVAGGEGGEDEASRAARPRRVRPTVRPTTKTAADSREGTETGRLVIATGRLDIAAVADAVRANPIRARAAAAVAGPLAGLAPTARLERQLARFAERRADGAEERRSSDARARDGDARSARVPRASGRVADGVAAKTVTCVFFPRRRLFPTKKTAKKPPSERAPSVLYASRVEVFLLGFGLGKANAGALLAACGDPGPAPLPRATRDGVSAARRDAIPERALREDAQNVPPGWYHDGTKWIDFDGSISHRHPLFAERIDALVEETNKEIEFENALRAEARDAARVTTSASKRTRRFSGRRPRRETVVRRAAKGFDQRGRYQR